MPTCAWGGVVQGWFRTVGRGSCNHEVVIRVCMPLYFPSIIAQLVFRPLRGTVGDKSMFAVALGLRY